MKKLIAVLAFIGLAANAFALTVSSEYEFPSEFKAESQGNVEVKWSWGEYYSEIQGNTQVHYAIFRVTNNRNQNVNLPLSNRNFSFNINGQYYGAAFFERVNWSQFNDCEYSEYEPPGNQSEVNRTVCSPRVESTWNPSPFTNITLARGQSKTFLAGFNTSYLASGTYNVSLRSGANDWFIDPTLSACGTIASSGYYTLTTNLATTSATSCISVATSNVVVDCAGFSVNNNGISVAQRHAISALTALGNITVKNCVIGNASANLTNGVSFLSITNLSIQNNTFGPWTGRNNTNGSTGATCTDGSTGMGVIGARIRSSNNVSIANNSFVGVVGGAGGDGGTATGLMSTGCNGAQGGTAYAISLGFPSGTTLNVTIENNTFEGVDGGWGGGAGNGTLEPGLAGTNGETINIYDVGGNPNTTIINNRFIRVTARPAGMGGIIYGQSSIRCIGVLPFQGNGSAGLDVTAIYSVESLNLTMENNTVELIVGASGGMGGWGNNLRSGAGGIGGNVYPFQHSGTVFRIHNNTVLNATGGLGGAQDTTCVLSSYPSGDGGNATAFLAFTSGNVSNLWAFNVSGGAPGASTNKGKRGIGIGVYLQSAWERWFINSTILASDLMAYADFTATGYNVFLNTSFYNYSKAFNSEAGAEAVCNPSCNYTVAWYGRVNVTDANSAPLTADVNVTDNQTVQKYLVSSTTLTDWLFLYEGFYNDFSGNVSNISYTAHNVSAKTATLANWTYFNYTSRDLTCWIILFASSVLPPQPNPPIEVPFDDDDDESIFLMTFSANALIFLAVWWFGVRNGKKREV